MRSRSTLRSKSFYGDGRQEPHNRGWEAEIAFVLIFLLTVFGSALTEANPDFVIVIEREAPQGKMLYGQITVNDKIIGRTYENLDVEIPEGEYKGILRYFSKKGLVQGPLGQLGNTGDFLLEVTGAKGRTDILLDGGNKVYQTEGCILLGGVARDPSTLIPTVGPDHPLRKLRKLFYGTDNPDSTPDKSIRVVIKSA